MNISDVTLGEAEAALNPLRRNRRLGVRAAVSEQPPVSSGCASLKPAQCPQVCPEHAPPAGSSETDHICPQCRAQTPWPALWGQSYMPAAWEEPGFCQLLQPLLSSSRGPLHSGASGLPSQPCLTARFLSQIKAHQRGVVWRELGAHSHYWKSVCNVQNW